MKLGSRRSGRDGTLLLVSRDLTRSNQTSDDRPRTIPISTDYIGTTTFNLVDADLQFMIESGRKHTKAFLDAHRAD